MHFIDYSEKFLVDWNIGNRDTSWLHWKLYLVGQRSKILIIYIALNMCGQLIWVFVNQTWRLWLDMISAIPLYLFVQPWRLPFLSTSTILKIRISNNWSHFQSFMSTNKIKFDKSSVGCLKMNWVFFARLSRNMRGKLEFSESKQCCAEHIKMPLLLCRQGAIDWEALSWSLSSSPPPCALLLFILPLLFPPHHLACSINIGQ